MPPFLNADVDGASRMGVPTLGVVGVSCLVNARRSDEKLAAGEKGDAAGEEEGTMLTSGLFESEKEFERARDAPRMFSACAGSCMGRHQYVGET